MVLPFTQTVLVFTTVFATVFDGVRLDPSDVVGAGLGEGIADDPHRDDGLLSLGPLGHALEARGDALLLAGLHVVQLPDDDLFLSGEEDVSGE